MSTDTNQKSCVMRVVSFTVIAIVLSLGFSWAIRPLLPERVVATFTVRSNDEEFTLSTRPLLLADHDREDFIAMHSSFCEAVSAESQTSSDQIVAIHTFVQLVNTYAQENFFRRVTRDQIASAMATALTIIR